MFKRRKALTILQSIRQSIWPSMGWKRGITYIKHRILRLSGSTHSIALGLSIGLGVSFTPLIGVHLIQAIIIAWILRANIFASIMGTFVGNPWTFPFFWWAGFSLGNFLFGIFGIKGAGELPRDLTLPIIWDMVFSEPLTLFLPWMLGGYLLVILTIFLSYPIYYLLIREAKIVREKAKELARKQLKK